MFFQHQVANTYRLEDGAVNRAFADVALGVGVRVVKGDQTGYGYTEELTRRGPEARGETAAAIADGPPRPGPGEPQGPAPSPRAIPCKTRWEDVRPEEKLPLLARA